MKERVKKKWLEALRSGQYVQTTGALCHTGDSGDSFCCLGVLCNLRAEESKTLYWEEAGVYPWMSLTFQGADGLPPTSVFKWAGLERFDADTLASMNDDRGYSFEEIADWIQREL
jgi:hypothetical protein